MRKSIPVLLVLAAILISGCLPKAQATPPATQAVTQASTQPAARATFPVANPTTNAQSAVVTVPAQGPQLPDSGCTVVTQKPIAGPTAVSPYPPVSSTDWVEGPAGAKVTIIEYSDFQ